MVSVCRSEKRRKLELREIVRRRFRHTTTATVFATKKNSVCIQIESRSDTRNIGYQKDCTPSGYFQLDLFEADIGGSLTAMLFVTTRRISPMYWDEQMTWQNGSYSCLTLAILEWCAVTAMRCKLIPPLSPPFPSPCSPRGPCFHACTTHNYLHPSIICQLPLVVPSFSL